MWKDDREVMQYEKLDNLLQKNLLFLFTPVFRDSHHTKMKHNEYLYWLMRHYFIKDLANIIVNGDEKENIWQKNDQKFTFVKRLPESINKFLL